MRLFGAGAWRAHVDEESLSGYLDYRVTTAERARIEEHLRICATCQAELSSLRQTVQLLRALPRVAVPRAFTLTEAQVGRVPIPAAPVPWFGGALRGAAVLAGLTVVLALGAILLNRRGLAPPTQLARIVAVEPTSTPTLPPMLSQAAELPTPDLLAAPAPTLQPATAPARATQVPTRSAGAQAERALTDSTQPPAAAAAAPRPAPSATSVSAKAAAPAAPAGPAPAPPALPNVVPSPPAPPAAVVPGPSAVPSAAALAMAPRPTAAPTAQGPTLAAPAAAARSGGGPVGTAPAEAEGPLPAAAIAAAFPREAGLTYTDGQGLWTIDRQSGLRQIGTMPGASSPLISTDRSWIACRTLVQTGSEIRAVRWDGSNARELVNDAILSGAEQNKPGAVLQLAGEFRWIPGTHRLAFVVAVQDSPAGQPTRTALELWDVDADTGALRHVVDLAPNAAFAYSANGMRVAVLKRGGPGQDGSLTILGADGTSARIVLDFPANLAGLAYEGQLAWLPDGTALWAAIPDKDAVGTTASSGISLYRIRASSGGAEAVGHIEASDSAWSPDGTRLAYLKPVANASDRRQLVLANAEGANPQSFATISGAFQSWSPDSRYFLYSNEGVWYAGAAGQPPRRLGDTSTMIDPHWLNAQQLVYPAIQPDGWVLALASLDDKTVSLIPLPKAPMFDATRR